jgi:hypothetical protein
MDRLPREIIDKVVSHMPIDDEHAFAEGTKIRSARRADPVAYLSTTFKYAFSLLAAACDKGCVISGSMAQEFILPGSIGDHLDWDIYVPGNAKSVTNMLLVLSKSGVT